MKLTVVALFVLVLTGCVADGYSRFYREAPGATPETIARLRVNPPPETPEVMHVAQFNIYSFLQQGYAEIGYSSFNSGGNQPDSYAIAQGKKLGADIVVIVDPSYTGSITSQVPLTMPNSTTSYTNGTATAYGAGGSVTAYGNSTTTTYGTSTTYIPMTVNRYNFGAAYLVKRKYELGIQCRPLNSEERQQVQSNYGMYIILVVNDSPAFRSDILPGDILESINGEKVYGQASFSELLNEAKGKKTKLTIYRKGHMLKKDVQLN